LFVVDNFQINNNRLCYYFLNVSRFGEENFIPSIIDVLRVKQPTTAYINQFTVDTSDMKSTCFIDVGGKRPERRNWPNELVGVTFIIYLVSMDEYDMKLEEDNESNRLIESLKLWKFILTREYLLDIPILLIFSKSDILKEKN